MAAISAPAAIAASRTNRMMSSQLIPATAERIRVGKEALGLAKPSPPENKLDGLRLQSAILIGASEWR
jgi:hypothetical protein